VVYELFAALTLMENDKSPGTDGLTKELYLSLFHLTGEVLTAVVNLSFENEHVSDSQRLSYITFICN
jgi:hypothetical protein